LTPEELTKEKERLKEAIAGQTEVKVTSLYFQLFVKRGPDETSVELLWGDSYLKETMMDNALEFRISPNAFFQINTAAAEVCYQTISDLIELTPETVLLDICCGTGTIGLYLASRVKRVIGIELNGEAISDARVNAQVNGIKNAEYVKGRAEEMVAAVVKRYGPETDLVAIIDPPRAGLNASVVKALRATEGLKKLVYVSCEPRIAKQNLVDLCRLPSKAYRGVPFIPCKAIPVDMFPQTDHCEVLILYKRITMTSNGTPAPGEERLTPEPIGSPSDAQLSPTPAQVKTEPQSQSQTPVQAKD
jgi:tRNA (uracil-5-)-methyltransferase